MPRKRTASAASAGSAVSTASAASMRGPPAKRSKAGVAPALPRGARKTSADKTAEDEIAAAKRHKKTPCVPHWHAR